MLYTAIIGNTEKIDSETIFQSTSDYKWLDNSRVPFSMIGIYVKSTISVQDFGCFWLRKMKTHAPTHSGSISDGYYPKDEWFGVLGAIKGVLYVKTFYGTIYTTHLPLSIGYKGRMKCVKSIIEEIRKTEGTVWFAGDLNFVDNEDSHNLKLLNKHLIDGYCELNHSGRKGTWIGITRKDKNFWVDKVNGVWNSDIRLDYIFSTISSSKSMHISNFYGKESDRNMLRQYASDHCMVVSVYPNVNKRDTTLKFYDFRKIF